MKRGSMKFWICASLALAAACAAVAAAATPQAQKQDPAPAAGQVKFPELRHPNETLLAGLRPGRDTFAVAEKRFKPKDLSDDSNSSSKEWRDACSGRSIRLEGLDPTNDKATARAIVVHGAWYVSEEIIAHFGMLGRSEGCLAVANSSLDEVLARLGPGRLIYADKV